MNPKISVDTIPDGEMRTVVLLEGKTADPINLTGVKIAGNISAVKDFLAKREATANQKTSHIEVDEQNGTILLLVDANSPLSVEVLAKLYRPKPLNTIDINGSATLELKPIADILRKHRFLFAEITEYDKVIMYLNKFKAKVETEIERERNTSNGSNRQLVDKKVTVESVNFKVKTPLYVGGPEKTFLVDVCCDITDGGARFWLESLDLIELEKTARREAMDAELVELRKYEYAIIEK